VQRAIPEVGEGGRLRELLRGQRLEGYEKSFKLSHGTLLAERVLVGVPRAGARPESLVDVCRHLAMPSSYLDAFAQGLGEADTVHFGYEEDGDRLLYKAYLEYARRFHRAKAGDAPLLLHLAYKWDARRPERRAIARYEYFPGLAAAGMLARMERIYPGRADAPSLRAAREVIALATAVAGEPPMYLEAAEEGNPRSSFDINVHPAGLRVARIESFLRDLQAQYEIPESRFAPVWARTRDERLGHVSGGTSRDGGDFFTVYHEVGAH